MNFLITALPRSGTAWASVWLMDGALCLHDPLAHRTPEQVLAYAPSSGQRWGAACTGAWLVPGFIQACACPYVLLDRNLADVQQSIVDLHLPPLSDAAVAQFDLTPGPRFDYNDLFDLDGAKAIWGVLRPDMPMNVERWALLTEMMIQTDFYKWNPDPVVIQGLVTRLVRG